MNTYVFITTIRRISMKTVLVIFLSFLTCLYAMDMAPYKYPLSFSLESQRKVDVPLHALGFQETKEENFDLDKSLDIVSHVPLKHLAYQEWLKGNFLLLARIVTMSFEQQPVVSWCDMRELVDIVPRSPRLSNRAKFRRFSAPNKCGEILYYFVPHDKYTHALGYLCSETNLHECVTGDFCSFSADLTRFLAMYHTVERNQLKVQLLESIIKAIDQVNQKGDCHIPFIQRHYQSLLSIQKLLCKEKRSRKDHKMIASQEINKEAQVASQVQLGYRYLKRKNIKEAVKWLSKAAEQDFFPEKRQDAQEILDCINDGTPLLFTKKGKVIPVIGSMHTCQDASGSGKDEAEEYS